MRHRRPTVHIPGVSNMTRDERTAKREARRIAADMAGVEDYYHAKRSIKERERIFARFVQDLHDTNFTSGWVGKVGGP